LDFRTVPFDSTVAMTLVEEVQAEYVIRYGGPDETPLDPGEFAPPQGIFVVGWEGEEVLGCGGVRLITTHVAELKRMYVRPRARRRGVARKLLQQLEHEAAALGAKELRLETGSKQPEAIALYRSAGYVDTEPFGHYAESPLAFHLAKSL